MQNHVIHKECFKVEYFLPEWLSPVSTNEQTICFVEEFIIQQHCLEHGKPQVWVLLISGGHVRAFAHISDKLEAPALGALAGASGVDTLQPVLFFPENYGCQKLLRQQLHQAIEDFEDYLPNISIPGAVIYDGLEVSLIFP